jgi:hypothetical protein
MMFTLTALLDGYPGEVVSFDTEDSLAATIEGTMIILDKAYVDKQGPWAKGEITLRDEDGNVLHRMDAKV